MTEEAKKPLLAWMEPGPCCARCRFWQDDDPVESMAITKDEADGTEGTCRRYAPRPSTADGDKVFVSWPTVWADNWCGDFQEKQP